MIGTTLIEELVQSVALSHLIKGGKRASLLMLAAPESGKTTIVSAANCAHVCRVAVISGRSIMREVKDHPETEFLLFNDLTAVRAMSASAVNLLILILNQFTQDERGLVAFAGKESEYITRPIGILACLPFKTFIDHRARWREMGFISRMIPFAYHYDDELIAAIKDSIDDGHHATAAKPLRVMPKRNGRKPVTIEMHQKFTRELRHLADARAKTLGQLGIRLLQNYHVLVRAHALLMKRTAVTREDMTFLRHVDHFVSIEKCEPLIRYTPTMHHRLEDKHDGQATKHHARASGTPHQRRRHPRARLHPVSTP
jgi:hypothetical protein